MKTASSATAQSILKKLQTYCKLAGAKNYPDGFATFVDSPAVMAHGIGFLRGLSKEVDVWMRDLEPDKQNELVQQMRTAGVLDSDLPNTSTTKIVRRLLKLKRPLSPEEKLLLRTARSSWRNLALSATEIAVLHKLNP